MTGTARGELELLEGCRIARLPLGYNQWPQTAQALYPVIAWGVNRLMRLSSLGDMPADLVFEPG